MAGIAYLLFFILCGCLFSEGLLRRHTGLFRLIAGISTGLVMMMWLPSLFAFAFDFTLTAHLLALLPASGAGIAGVCLARRGRSRDFWGGVRPVAFFATVIPLTVLMAYLLSTHYLYPADDGSLHVGQSTYGDLSLHVGIATGLAGQSYPADYTILTGELLGYPYLSDAMAGSMILLGTGIRAAFISTALAMFLVVVSGSYLFFREETGSDRGAVLSQVLLYLCGGLGFAYSTDLALSDTSRFTSIFTEYYMTPANRPTLNIWWVNVLCDSLLPQRTLLAGWSVLFPCLLLLKKGLTQKDRAPLALFGVLAGALPMIHTHSFLALAVLSAGVALHLFVTGDKRELVRLLLPPVAIAGCLSIPQVIVWTLPQSTTESVIRFQPGWVNNDGSGLKDETLWFWVKNVGPVFLALFPAALSEKRGTVRRGLCLGSAILFVIANLFLFQRNPYDNNKLLLVAFFAALPSASKWLLAIWDKLHGIRGRALIAAVFLVVSTLSGVLSIARECVSDYQLYSAYQVEDAENIRSATDTSSVVLTGTYFNDPVSVLAGRHIVCGPDLYLYYHGFDTSERQRDIARMYESPEESASLFEKYGVTHVYISWNEENTYDIDREWFDENLTVAYSSDTCTLYAFP